jgi:hypothetical protein
MAVISSNPEGKKEEYFSAPCSLLSLRTLLL